jgi:immunoglobulin-like protein involved in spore germination
LGRDVKGFGAAVILALAALLIAGCGGDTTTTFVLSNGTPAASSSASGSPGASTSPAAEPTGSTLPNTAATPIPDGSKIIIDTPDAGTTITSPVDVSGTASVDKGTVVAVVLDAAGNELGRGTTVASAVRPDWGHYDASVSFSGATPGTKGKIKVFGVNPRDGVTPTFYYFIVVSFS